MTQNLYNVVFRGALTGAKPEDEVKFELGALFNAPAEKIEALFSGRPVVVKRNVDAATATKFRGAFERAGAFCELVKADGDGQTSEPRQASSPARAQPNAGADAPASGVAAVTAAPPPAAGSTSAASAAGDSIACAGDPNGTVLERPVSADLSGLAIDNSDRPHQPHEEVPPPQVDISSLSLAEDDAPLSPPRQIPTPTFDTGGMSLEPAPSEARE